MTIQTPLWEFVDISKAYPGVLANDKVNIKLLPGSIHGLLGENGCGKSTMINPSTPAATESAMNRPLP